MKPVIRLEHIEKVFTDGKEDFEALRDVSLEVNEGDIFGIIGLSGAGKSTLVRCLNLLERPTSGKVYVNDKDMMTLSEPEIRRCRQKIVMVFQHFNLLMQRTVLGNFCFPLEIVGMSRKDAKKRAMEVLKLVGIADKANAYPSQLSGGQKQRVAIAGVLAMQPKTIVLDEPTAMLDPQGRQEVVSIVEKLSREQNITVVLITHHMDEAVCADRVIAMDDGKIIADGTPKEVFTQIELLKRVGLTVPQTTLLLDALKQDGCALPLDALSVDECADALYQKIMQAKA